MPREYNDEPVWYEEQENSYEVEEEYDDVKSTYSDDSWENDDEPTYSSRWPGTRVAYPPVSFLVKHSAPIDPKPKPVDPDSKNRYDKYMEVLNGWKEKKTKLLETLGAKSEEIRKAEATPATFGSKWADKAKGTGRDALISRLTKEADELQKQLDAVTKEILKLDTSNKALAGYIKACEYAWDLYEKGVKEEREGWVKVYGHHIPIKSLDQLKRYYNASVTPGNEPGYLHAYIPDDLQVGQAFRELKLGGHEYVRRVNWNTLEVIESVFNNPSS
jgi:hypothetical protein